jgi:hypothetical protein
VIGAGPVGGWRIVLCRDADTQPCACTPVAQLRRTLLPGGQTGFDGITRSRIPRPLSAPRRPRSVVRRRDRRRADGDAPRAEGGCIHGQRALPHIAPIAPMRPSSH